MVRHLHKRFLSNAKEYRESENFWCNLCEKSIESNTNNSKWKVWFNTYYADGTPFLDGSPIYSLISSNKKKGVAIYQEEPTIDNIKITAWMDKFGAVDKNDDFVEELVITCELSEESAKIAEELITEWVKDNTTYKDMEIIIEERVYSKGLYKG